MSARRFGHVTMAQLRMIFRRRITLFWSLVFPMILMALLAVLFGRDFSGGTVVVVDQASMPAATELTGALEKSEALEVERSGDATAARSEVEDGDKEAALVLQREDGEVRARLYFSNASASQAAVIQGIVAGAANAIAIEASGRQPAIAVQEISVDSASLDYVDFLLPGIIALSIMISAIYGITVALVTWRTAGVLRRLKLTPMPLSEFLLSRIAASLVLTLLQVAVLIAFGAVVFGVEISTDAWAAVPVALAGALCFLAMGFLVGSVISRAETADAVNNVITNPMMFLSGVFFPVAAMPEPLQEVAKLLPLYYMANGLRDTIVRGQALTHVLPEIGVLLVAAAVLAAASLKTFRWE